MTAPITTFVINLKRKPERRAAMEQMLAGHRLDVEFLAAIDGTQLDSAHFSTCGAGMSAGEIGCYLSHVAVWKRVLDEKLDFALVLEDDVELQPELAGTCAGLCGGGLGFDMVRLSSIMPARGTEILRLSPRSSLILPHANPSGSQGYLISRQGASKLSTLFGEPRRPVDKLLDEFWLHDLEILLLTPSLVRESLQFASDIDPTGPRWRRPPRGSLVQNWEKKLQRKLALRRMQHRLLGRLSAANRSSVMPPDKPELHRPPVVRLDGTVEVPRPSGVA